MSLPPILIDEASVARLAERLHKEQAIAVDLEADSLHSYREKVCLLQFSTPSETVLVDPLAVPDLSALAPVLADPAVRKIFHAADYDIRCLYRDFGFEIRGLFDTMIACQLLGEEKIGLADVLRKYFDIELDKRYQRADWSQRPLEEGMVRYAAEDTRHLHRLAGILEGRLADKGRLGWAREEFALLERVRHGEQSGPLFLRVKKAGTLDRRQLAVLESLLQWRDGEAKRRDCPPFKVVGNTPLFELARIMPDSLRAAAGVEGLSPKLLRRYGDAMLEAVEAGREVSPERLPAYPRGEPRVRDPEVDRLVTALKQWRTAVAAELEMDPGVLINNSLLEEIARVRPRKPADLEGLPAMKDWQRRELGEGIIAVLSAEC
jgi:ribonuclease D